MDSVSQIVLGASVATAVMGRKAGYRAPLWGAVLGTLPDLDVLIPMGGPVADFTYHRSFSHSLLVLAALSPAIAWLLRKLHPAVACARREWLALVLLVLLTHPLLDAFTIYGTQLWWPLDTTPVGLGSIFIIDPLYTLPLLLGAFGFLCAPRQRLGLRANAAGLILSSLYLLWSASMQQLLTRDVHQQLAASGASHQQVLVQPAPFTTLLWRAVVMEPQGYREGFYSLFDAGQPLQWRHYPSSPQLLDGLRQHWPVERLAWFSKGFYAVNPQDDELLISDLRMGLEPDYVFRFAIARREGERWVASPDRRLIGERSLARLPGLWQRIWQRPDDANAPGF